MDACQVFWGEMHDNACQHDDSRPATESIARAATHLDFYGAAFYTATFTMFPPEQQEARKGRGGEWAEGHGGTAGLRLEGWKAQERLDREWALVQETVKAANQPGTFVTFPGYEWQGDGSGGDHNVIHRHEGMPIHHVNTLTELYERLRGQQAIAIPHHTAYRPGRRGRDWSVFDETISPFAEIYSVHGCSETDDEWVPLRRNWHMGPGLYPGTWQAALDRGLHVGAMCSNDNWGEMPGHFDWGIMACLAEELTRERLWEAFLARRVYGVTGDRIVVDFRVNDAAMGSIIKARGKRSIRVNVVGQDAVDRIELLRNERVIATHCHQGAWPLPRPGQSSRFRMRIEAGWGPLPDEVVTPDHHWHGELAVAGCRILGSTPCWVTPGQTQPDISGDTATFRMVTQQKGIQQRWQNANVFEFEADPACQMRIRLNGREETGTVAEFAAGSREMWFKDECVKMLQETTGLPAGSPERDDIYHHLSRKAKLHRPIPEAGYTASLEYEDDEPIQGEIHYRVRVEQRNGQRAWTSPIWVSA